MTGGAQWPTSEKNREVINRFGLRLEASGGQAALGCFLSVWIGHKKIKWLKGGQQPFDQWEYGGLLFNVSLSNTNSFYPL